MSVSLAQAYLEQAKADYATYEVIRNTPQQPSSQWLHLLQMALEKTAKAYLAAANPDFDQLRESHRVFRRFIHILPRNRQVQASLRMRPAALRQHMKSLELLVDDIERLIPGRNNQGPTIEYPWRNPLGGFHSPCLYDFGNVTSALNTARGRNLLRVLERGLSDVTWHAAFGIVASPTQTS